MVPSIKAFLVLKYRTSLMRSGLLDDFELTTFELDRATEPVAHAATNSGPFRMTVLRPS